MLADVLGVPSLVNRHSAPLPGDFDANVVERISANWVDFNVGFENVQTKTFDKYAARLGESVLPENRQDPAYVLPPYTMVRNMSDGWEDVSRRMWDASVDYAKSKNVAGKLRRVLAADSASIWTQLAAKVMDDEIVAWVSDLDEFKPSSENELLLYGEALKAAKRRGQRVFALYGGFFSVLLARHGLTGSSHGIGFGEYRDWIELPSSGAPPARYYVPRLHRYVGVDVATTVWRQFPELVSCDCEECSGQSPATLDYHALMRHSVRVRSAEISAWLDLPTDEVVAQLNRDHIAYRDALGSLNAPVKLVRRVADSYSHLSGWARVISQLG